MHLGLHHPSRPAERFGAQPPLHRRSSPLCRAAPGCRSAGIHLSTDTRAGSSQGEGLANGGAYSPANPRGWLPAVRVRATYGPRRPSSPTREPGRLFANRDSAESRITGLTSLRALFLPPHARPAWRHTPLFAPSDLAWRVIGLVNLYRLLVPLVLLAIVFLPGLQAVPGQVAAQPFPDLVPGLLLRGRARWWSRGGCPGRVSAAWHC